MKSSVAASENFFAISYTNNSETGKVTVKRTHYVDHNQLLEK